MATPAGVYFDPGFTILAGSPLLYTNGDAEETVLIDSTAGIGWGYRGWGEFHWGSGDAVVYLTGSEQFSTAEFTIDCNPEVGPCNPDLNAGWGTPFWNTGYYCDEASSCTYLY